MSSLPNFKHKAKLAMCNRRRSSLKCHCQAPKPILLKPQITTGEAKTVVIFSLPIFLLFSSDFCLELFVI